ncbi:exosome complex component rrp40 [Vairimorpha apis BRL 01]|uniref:Exosome complex component rrp40 n=1 Tax=Vairimorpha apis BRL 01 TaxID=1037528 RepID=T0L1X6_9MICR|nr:exosome complex component rrp40 [Vairimorpha apis BRL 01]
MRFSKLRTVFPGDEIYEQGSTSLGIYNRKSYVYGTLCKTQNHLFILSKTKRYNPYIDDVVVGKVIYVSSDYYKLDINCSLGILPVLNFTNASKRNKPDINKDDLIFCKIVSTGIEPILSCIGEGFGKIKGFFFKIDVWQSQMLYAENILFKIGKKYNFKCIVGINGVLIISCETAKLSIEIYNKIIDELKIL